MNFSTVKFTEAGRITVDCRLFSEGSELLQRLTTSSTSSEVAIEIVVTDTGCGMSLDALEDIFCQLEEVENRLIDSRQPQAGLG